MKIQILRNGIKNLTALESGINKAVQLLKEIGVSLEVIYKDIDKNFSNQPVKSDVVTGFGINPQEILNLSTGNPDIVCLISTWTKVTPNNWSPSNPINPCTYDLDQTKLDNTLVMEITEEWYNGYDWVLTQFFLHEFCHAIYYRTAGVTDRTHFQYADPKYSQLSPNIYYLNLINLNNNLNKNLNPIYKYFSEKEVIGLKPELVQILDKIREECGFSLKITSGLRTEVQNNALQGAVSDSAHLTGFAVDLSITDSAKRFKLVTVALKNGINRIGIGKDFVHLDVAPGKPTNVMWHYY